MKARRSVDLIDRYLSEDNNVEHVERGDYEVQRDLSGVVAALVLSCPGCGSIQALPVRYPGHHPSKGVLWDWDGNEDLPTLSPSINHVGCWHGFLRAGELTSC